MTLDTTQIKMEEMSIEEDEKQKQTVRLAKGLAAHNMKPLSENFVLGEHDVICGRGRKCFNHTGNVRFRKMVQDSLSKYSDASAKLEKTYIICDIVNQVRKNSTTNGGFVKKDPMSGRYFEVGDFLAREKTSQAFRDALHDQYKSSNAAKKKRRLRDQAQKLHRQHSAPLLSAEAIRESSGENMNDSMKSLQPYGSSSFDETQYVVNNSKFMRVERQPSDYSLNSNDSTPRNSDLLLGELIGQQNNDMTLHDKRSMFASQKSATSIIDEANQSAPAWFNRSCPNLVQVPQQHHQHQHQQTTAPSPTHQPPPTQLTLLQPMEDVEEEPNDTMLFSQPNMYNDWHHSQPDLFMEPTRPMNEDHQEAMASGRPNLLLNRIMAGNKKQRHRQRRSHSVRNLNCGISSSFELYEQPQKRPMTTTSTTLSHHEDIILSPIGDGSIQGLCEKLEDIAESTERNLDDVFEPIPF